jgi:hypothetical protein
MDMYLDGHSDTGDDEDDSEDDDDDEEDVPLPLLPLVVSRECAGRHWCMNRSVSLVTSPLTRGPSHR